MRTGVEEMREKDNKIPADDIDTFGFTEEELEMLGQLAGEMLERETRAYEERIQTAEKDRQGRTHCGHISHKHCHGGRHRYGDIGSVQDKGL